MVRNIVHSDCTFYIYGASKEWAYFSGKYIDIEAIETPYKINPETGYFTAIFQIDFPERYDVYCFVSTDVRNMPINSVLQTIEKYFLQQLLKAQQEQQVAMIQLIGALNSSLNIKSLLQKIMDYAIQAIPTIDRGFLMLFNETTGKLHTVAQNGATEKIFDYSPSIGEGIAGYTFQTGESGVYNHEQSMKIMANLTPANTNALLGAFKIDSFEHHYMMAVPIFFEWRKFGVMIVHQYTNKRVFKNNDLVLLKSFATQAAVALRNAEVYERMELLNAHYEQNNQIHQIFLDLTLQNADVHAIIQKTNELLNKSIHYINLFDQTTFLNESMMNDLKKINEPKFYYMHDTYVYPVQNEQDVFGYLSLSEKEDLDNHQKMIIENAGLSLALKALQVQAKTQASFRERYELFQHILLAHAPLIDPRYDDLNLNVYGETFCITFKLSQLTNRYGVQFIEYLLHHFPTQRFIFTQSDQVVWVLQGDEAFRLKVVRQLPSTLSTWVHFNQQIVTIGVGTIRKSLLQLEESYTESELALRYHQKETVLSVVCYEDIGINRLFGKHTSTEIQQFVTQVLEPIISRKDLTLFKTLACYIQQNCSISKTASELHIHQNTLYHRLKRIEQSLNKELDNAEHFLEISLAVYLFTTNKQDAVK